MSISIEDTWAAKTIEAFKDAAREAGQVLEYPHDFPNDCVGQYEHLKRLQSISNKIDTVITSMSRQSVRTKDKNGKVVTKEYLTIGGEFTCNNYRGVPYARDFLIGKHNRPNVVVNVDQKFDPETGKALRAEKILSGQHPIFTIELPKDAAKRKKMIDEFIGDNDANAITFYYREYALGNVTGKRDGTLSYEQFATNSIEELKDISAKGTGGKGTGYYRDKDGKLKDKDGNPVV